MERDYCHAVFLAMVEYCDWQMQIIFFQERTTDRSFEVLCHCEKEFVHKLQKISAFKHPGWLELPSLTAGATFKKSTRKLPWDSGRLRHCVSCPWSARAKVPNFPVLSDCLFTATALIVSNRCPHGCYTFSSMFYM